MTQFIRQTKLNALYKMWVQNKQYHSEASNLKTHFNLQSPEWTLNVGKITCNYPLNGSISCSLTWAYCTWGTNTAKPLVSTVHTCRSALRWTVVAHHTMKAAMNLSTGMKSRPTLWSLVESCPVCTIFPFRFTVLIPRRSLSVLSATNHEGLSLLQKVRIHGFLLN